ncbi:FAR1 DNA binding domain [Macleaya cordata]|uniref:Protein FAR1-RELATED SEQUENCE n=1 Tax=Macleaya cordata TaxID=56857 RepID=A0A200Q080_MACCD|nr:FAR1 DNA binding domain [Macleaya cordata]
MDVEVIDVETQNRGTEDAEPHDGGEEEMTGNSTDKEVLSQDEDGAAEPHVDMEFDSEDAAKTFYDSYARRVGFSTRVGQYSRSKPDGTVTCREFVCSREGLKRKNAESCNAMLKIERKDSGKWVATKFVKEHNHSTVSPSKVHYLRPRRHFAGAAKTAAETYAGVGLSPSGIMYVSVDGNRVPVDPNRPVRNAPAVEARVETISSFFDGYVNHQTTLPLFFRQYERVLENGFEKEIEADFDTICTTPVLKTPSPMEKQAANLYTRKIFTKFQEELVETFVYTANKIEGDGAISTYRVAKFEDDHKAYIVTMNVPEMRASCSCQMFEFSGILCRHVLTVFTVTNVLTLPSHYILRRWTRNAKSTIGSDERGSELQGQESVTMRYNNLCREAMKYAEEGAIASETYNVAMAALKDGGKKITVAKKNVARAAPPSSGISGSNLEDSNKKTAMSVSDMTPSLWPRQEEVPRRFNQDEVARRFNQDEVARRFNQDEVARRFNLNDAGAPTPPVADLNLPRMAPISLHRDDPPLDNMVVLPCLKSMTWVMENKGSSPANRVAVINLKLHDYGKTPSGESEVKFQLSRITLEPMLKSMAYIGEQLSTPANRVAVINLKLQDTESISGESEVKFQFTSGSFLRPLFGINEKFSLVFGIKLGHGRAGVQQLGHLTTS